MNKKYILSICLIAVLPLRGAQMSKIKVACVAGLMMTAQSLPVLAVSQTTNQTSAQTPFLDFVESAIPEITAAIIVKVTFSTAAVMCWSLLVPHEYFFMYAPL